MLDIQAELIDEITQDLPTDRDVTPIDTYTDRAVFNAGLLEDGAGNLIEGYSTLQGNTTVVRLFRVDHTSGQRTPIADISPPPGFKLDSAAMTPSGANLILGMTAHEAISSPTRRNIYARALVPGVLTPYPGGMEPRGAWIDPALLGGGEPMPNPEPTFTVADIMDAMKAEMSGELGDLIQKLAKNGSRQGVQLEVNSAGGVLHEVITTANMGQAYADSYPIQVQLDNRVYAVLRQHRVLEAVAKILGIPYTVPDEPETPPQP